MPQDKTLWKNNTIAQDPEGKGWTIGVSVYDRDNKETSQPLQSGETIWLTVDERILTANAPREEKDNPFTNGHLVQVQEEARPIGRSIGGDGTTQDSAPAPAAPPVEPEPTPEPPVPPAAPAAPEPRDIGDGEKAELPPELRLGGDNDTGAGEAPAMSGPIQVVDGGIAEEHAAVEANQETGASVPPAGDAPEGEFAQHEEVGDPAAAAASETAAVTDERPAPSPDPIDQEMGLSALTPPAEETPDHGQGGRFKVK